MLLVLSLPDSEHLGTALRADTLSRRLLVLHGDFLGILDFNLFPAFHAIRSHIYTSLLIKAVLLPRRVVTIESSSLKAKESW